MAFRDRIEVVIDFVTTGAHTGLKKLRADVAAADTATGKAKAGITAMGGALQQYGTQAALAAGAALVTFGVKSVKAFQDSALAAAEFSDRAGIGVEDASRWIAVADDFDIAGESVQTAFQRMNLAIAANKFEQFGLDVIKAKDGTVDANATFLQTATEIGKIPDSAQRAQAAQAIFGKSWGDISRLMQMDAKDLTAALEGVSDAQVIDAEEEAKAKRLQAAMDELGDAFLDVQLIVGEQLAPTISDTIELFNGVKEGIEGIGKSSVGQGALNGIADTVTSWANPLGWAKGKFDDLRTAIDQVADGDFGPLREQTEGVTDAIDNETLSATELIDELGAVEASTLIAARSTEEYEGSISRLITELDGQREAAEAALQAEKDLYDQLRSQTDATLGYEKAVLDLDESYGDYLATLAEANADSEITEEELRNLATEHIDLKSSVLDTAEAFAESQGATEGSTEAAKLQIQELERLKLKFPELAPFIDGHIAKLNAIPKTINTTLVINQEGVVDFGNGGSDVRAGAAPMGGGFSGVVQAASSAWSAALSAWGANGGGGSSASQGPSVKEQQAAKFDAEFKRAKYAYERGNYTAPEYLAELERLRKAYKWRPLSDRGMSLWREMQRVRKDMRDLTKRPGGATDIPDGMTIPLPAMTSPNGGGGGGGGNSNRAGSTGGMGGVTVVINAPAALMVDGKSLRTQLDRIAPDMQRALNRYERQQG